MGKRFNYNPERYDINSRRNGFYPHYGTGSIRRGTNQYRRGETRGVNKMETRTQRGSRLSKTLSSHKHQMKKQNFIN